MRLQIIDLLRFIAAIGVVLYHYTARGDITSFPLIAPITQFGYLGVPLFFMISGFVISASTENRTPLEFVTSRITRLFPAYWFCIAFTLTVILLLENKSLPLTQILANLTMLNDYLGIKNIDGVYWTLQVELKFYGCVFLLLATKLFGKMLYWVSAWLFITLSYAAVKQPFFMPWIINPDFSIYFISGALAFLIFKKGPALNTLALYILSTSAAAYFCCNQVKGFAPWATGSHILIAAITIIFLHGLFLLIAIGKLRLATRPIYFILGGLTYPLYLIHNRAGKAFIDTFATAENKTWITGLAAALALCFAYIVFKYIEPYASVRLRHSLNVGFRKLRLIKS